MIVLPLTDRQRFGLALEACDDAGTGRSLDWLAGGPPGSGVEGLGYRLCVLENAETPAALAARLSWIDRVGFRATARATVAYDRCLAVTLARSGFAAGLLDEPSAWRCIDAQVTSVVRRYRSWAEYAEDYVAGREGREGMTLPWLRRFVATDLIDHARSPWRDVPWPADEPISGSW